jgi:hypothetical protein
VIYQRSFEIEGRLQAVLQLVETGKYSTPLIALELGVSIPTVSRDVMALRERGHRIQSNRLVDGSWRYGLLQSAIERHLPMNEDRGRKKA